MKKVKRNCSHVYISYVTGQKLKIKLRKLYYTIDLSNNASVKALNPHFSMRSKSRYEQLGPARSDLLPRFTIL